MPLDTAGEAAFRAERPTAAGRWSIGVPGWLDRWLGYRDRLLANPQFQARAASFLPTRLIARRRAHDLFDLCAGFVYSQVLLACVELRIFDLLLEEPRKLSELADRLKLPGDSCARLFEAAIALRLLERRSGGRYGLGALGAALAGNPALTAMIEHHRHLYADLGNPLALLRDGSAGAELAKYWPYAGAHRPSELGAEDVSEYSSLMTLSQPLVAEEVLDAYSMTGHRCLLDVGGGEGRFLEAAAAHSPGLQLMLFDLPAVAARAGARLAECGLAQRTSVFGGDFFTEPLPEGADVVSLIRVALDHDDVKVLQLLASVRAALANDGVLVLAEPMSDADAGEPMGAAYFGLYLLAMGRGRPRTRKEIAALLGAAGFRSVDFRRGRRVLRTGIAVAKP